MFFLVSEGQTPIHASVLALAQFAVLGLAFKLWLSINYQNLRKAIRVTFHIVSHTSFSMIILFGYWAKNNHPLGLFFLYPLAGLSVSLIGESIEEMRIRRCEKRMCRVTSN